jgi:kynurenine formamidase
MARRWLRRPEGSNWGEFGDDDQIGRLNLITPRRRRAALREARDGIVFPLSLPLNLPGPGVHVGKRAPPRFEYPLGQNIALDQVFGVEGAIDVGNDDCVMLTLQYSTQWDGLAHMGAQFDADADGVAETVFYNGYRLAFTDQGASALGVDTIATTCVQGRGVLVDLIKAFGGGVARIGYEALMAAFRAQRVRIEPGDFLCLYTGYADAVLEMGQRPDVARLRRFPGLDGADPRLLGWIADSGVAGICADNLAVEAEPAGHACGSALLPLHHHCLFKLGVHLGELWCFKELAAYLAKAKRTRFLLTAPPLRLPGAVGSPTMPVATV